MRDPDPGDLVAARQGRRGRALFQFGFEYCLRTARHADAAGKNHDWRCGCLHVDCFDAFVARNQRHQLSFAIRDSRANGSANAIADRDSTSYSVAGANRGTDGDSEKVAANNPNGLRVF